VMTLYRDWYRSAPEICSLYALNVSPAYFRHCIRQKFEQNRHVTDGRVIDILIAKGRMDYQETVNCWKMNDQILGQLLQLNDRPKQSFLQKFYQGRDEEAVLPAASGL